VGCTGAATFNGDSGISVDFDTHVLLANVVLVNHKVFSPYVWNEIPAWILDQKPDGDKSTGGIEPNVGFLVPLLALE
jgi:hypothetical protein